MKKNISIMIIENNLGYSRFLEDSIKKFNSQIFTASVRTLSSAITKLTEKNYDVILLCIENGKNPLEVLEQLQNNIEMIPIILIFEDISSNIDYEVLNMGAQDFFYKSSLNVQVLVSAMYHSVARFSFIIDYLQRNDQYKFFSLKVSQNISSLLKSKTDSLERDWFEKEYVKILIVDDEKFNLLVTQKLLSNNGFKSEICLSGEEALEKIKSENYSLVLLDIQMKGMDGYETCRKLKAIKPELYVIMLTGTVNNESITKSFNSGAMDFARKQFDNMELVVRVKNALQIMYSEIELKNTHEVILEKNKLLEQLIITDNLTGVYTRKFIIDNIDNSIYNGRRYNSEMSLIMLDIDHFKKINDKFGHIAGDKAIIMLAEILKKTLRRTDLVGRYGGDEFIILLPHTDINGGRSKAETVRKCVEEADFYGSIGSNITVSIGVCMYSDESNADDLVKKADNFLYLAKKNGRNRVEGE